MATRPPVTIDMTPEGAFRQKPAPAASWSLKIGVGAAIIAAGSVALIAAALLLWLASVLIPVAIAATLVAYVAFRIRKARLAHARRHVARH